jgi:hypothetical protein
MKVQTTPEKPPSNEDNVLRFYFCELDPDLSQGLLLEDEISLN